MKRSEQINELAKALADARKEFKDIIKNKKVSFKTASGAPFSYEYADLPEIHSAIIIALSNNGLSICQDVSEDDKAIETILMHTSGQSVHSRYPLLAKAEDMQSIGAAFTYARRMAINGLLNISSESDTDGHLQGEIHGKKEVKQTATQAVQGFIAREAPQRPAGPSGQGNSKVNPRT